jgi:hypothetical protein
MAKKWTRSDVAKVFEILIERGCDIVSHPKFRDLLNRDENLFTNQTIRQANGNIAYRSVDFDVLGLEDETFWDRIDDTPYRDLIEDNAAIALTKMAAKLDIIGKE